MAIAYLVLSTVMLLTGEYLTSPAPELERFSPALQKSSCRAINTHWWIQKHLQKQSAVRAVSASSENSPNATSLPLFATPPIFGKSAVLEKPAGQSPGTLLDINSVDEYREESVEGWTLRINKALIQQDQAAVSQAVDLLRTQLQEIKQQVPAAAVRQLQSVPLWFSPEYPNIPPRAEYHPDEGWLREHGRNPEMARGIEFTNIRIFAQETKRMPNFALHELAHAYHHQFLPEGFDNPQIKRAFVAAKEEGLYESVEQRFGDGRSAQVRGYALTNEAEYFAETTEALFSTNDFFPFQQEQLRQYDPRMFGLLRELWQVEQQNKRPRRR